MRMILGFAVGTRVIKWLAMIHGVGESLCETAPLAPIHSLNYQASPHQTGKVSARRYDEGTDLVIRQSLLGSLALSLLLFLTFALVLWTLFLPSGRSQYGNVSIEIPEFWTSRAAAVFTVLVLPIGIYVTIQHALIHTKLECRPDGLSCITPAAFRGRKTLRFERSQILCVNVGEERGDSVTCYVTVVETGGKEHRLPLQSLTREESVFIGEEVWWGLQSAPHNRCVECVENIWTLPG